MASHELDDMYRVDAPMEIPETVFVNGYQQNAVLHHMNRSRKRQQSSTRTHDPTKEPRSKRRTAPIVRPPDSLQQTSLSSKRNATHQAALLPNINVAYTAPWHNPGQLGSSTCTDASICEADSNIGVPRDIGQDVQG